MIIKLTCSKCGKTFIGDSKYIYVCCGIEMERERI